MSKIGMKIKVLGVENIKNMIHVRIEVYICEIKMFWYIFMKTILWLEVYFDLYRKLKSSLLLYLINVILALFLLLKMQFRLTI